MARTEAVVPSLSEVKNIKMAVSNDLAVSVEATKCSEGYSLEFWVTKNKATIGRIALIGGFVVSVNAPSLEKAIERGEAMFEGIMELISKGRQEAVKCSMSEESKGVVGLAHLKAHRAIEKASDWKKQVLMELNFLTEELGYRNAPQRALAEMDNISIEQMRSRVTTAREYWRHASK